MSLQRLRADVLVRQLVGGMGVELAVILDADVFQQVELGLEIVDVAFLVGEQLLEEVHGHIVLLFAAAGARLHVKGAGAVLGLEVAFQHFLDVLADHQGVDVLKVREALEEDDADDELVGVLHLLDQFLALLLGEPGEAPIVEQPIVQPILIDGGELVRQRLVEIFDDARISLHSSLSSRPLIAIMTR